MAVKGFARYQNLIKNISNWQEYIFNKSERKSRPLKFITRPHPISFKVPDALYQVFKEIFMEDFYVIDQLVKKLPANPVIIDIGANAGFFNILLFSKIKNAKVFAFEPMPSNIFLFEETIRTNPVMQSIHLTQMAVTGLPKDHIDLFTVDTEDNTVVSSIFSDFSGLNTKKISVPAKSLGVIIEENKLEQIDLLKLDCEGSEYDIIYNTDRAVFLKIGMMVIEVHQIDGEQNNLASLDKYLESLGYETRTLPVQEGSFYLEAIRK